MRMGGQASIVTDIGAWEKKKWRLLILRHLDNFPGGGLWCAVMASHSSMDYNKQESDKQEMMMRYIHNCFISGLNVTSDWTNKLFPEFFRLWGYVYIFIYNQRHTWCADRRRFNLEMRIVNMLMCTPIINQNLNKRKEFIIISPPWLAGHQPSAQK
jgi:hypothetical protein